MKPTLDDVQVVLSRFDSSDWDELRIDHEDFHLHVYKTPGERRAAPSSPPPAVIPPATTVSTPASQPSEPSAESPPPATQSTPSSDPSSDVLEIRAPSLGTFYRAPKPGAAPFVEVGQSVTPDTDLCILEVMKLFTSVQAGVTGTVREILTEDGSLVEHGQILFVIEPTAA